MWKNASPPNAAADQSEIPAARPSAPTPRVESGTRGVVDRSANGIAQAPAPNMTANASQSEPWTANMIAIPAKSAARLATKAGARPERRKARAISAPGRSRQAVAPASRTKSPKPSAGSSHPIPSSAGAASQPSGSARGASRRRRSAAIAFTAAAAPPGRAQA